METTEKILAGRYELGELLGRGGTSEVRAGWDLRLDRPVALKMLRRSVVGDTLARYRFQSEATAVAGLSHPHIVSILDLGEDQELPFIVMERLSGRTFAQKLPAAPLALDVVRTVAEDVLDALAYAHGRGLVHCDVKPGNVLMADDRWKVTDFGISQRVDRAPDATAEIVVVGTPGYIAPERFAGRPASPAADVWAVGVMLYEALSGRRPYAVPRDGLPVAVPDDKLLPLAKLRPDVDRNVAHCVHQALSTDPAARFEDARCMVEALRGARSTRVPEMPARDTIHRRSRGGRRKMTVGGVAAVTAALGVASVIVFPGPHWRAADRDVSTPLPSLGQGNAVTTTVTTPQTTPPSPALTSLPSAASAVPARSMPVKTNPHRGRHRG